MADEAPLPESKIAKRPLHFFWLVDYSGSMDGAKIATVNHAIREVTQKDIPGAVENHPEVQILMRAIKFADTASWHVGPQPQSLDRFVWPELSTDGSTATAAAIRLLVAELTAEKMPRRGYPPVCILLSDGYCTESKSEYDSVIEELNSLPWGAKAVRLAIGIGEKSQYDEDSLLAFVTPALQKEVGVLQAQNTESLTQYIKWASVTGSMSSSMSKSKADTVDNANVILGAPPPPPAVTDNTDVF